VKLYQQVAPMNNMTTGESNYLKTWYVTLNFGVITIIRVWKSLNKHVCTLQKYYLTL